MSKLYWLAQNSKIKKSSNNEYTIYNFGIPAFLSSTGFSTCPNAKACVSGCYARSGTYRFSNVANKYELRLGLTQSFEFKPTLIKEITAALHLARLNNTKVLIRVHDSGDFYNPEYQLAWYDIAKYFSGMYPNEVQFYAYTKMILQSNELSAYKPSNFTLIYSFGGKQDMHINLDTDRHALVFESLEQLEQSGYANASHDDLIALGTNNKIGLVYHGTKKYTNTTWNKVEVL